MARKTRLFFVTGEKSIHLHREFLPCWMKYQRLASSDEKRNELRQLLGLQQSTPPSPRRFSGSRVRNHPSIANRNSSVSSLSPARFIQAVLLTVTAPEWSPTRPHLSTNQSNKSQKIVLVPTPLPIRVFGVFRGSITLPSKQKRREPGDSRRDNRAEDMTSINRTQNQNPSTPAAPFRALPAAGCGSHRQSST
jgi:hypothetical protein